MKTRFTPCDLGYFFLFGRCVSAEAAAVFASPLVPFPLNVFDAAVPAFLPVVSFFAIRSSLINNHSDSESRRVSIQGSKCAPWYRCQDEAGNPSG
jgi:hypothetical protein